MCVRACVCVCVLYQGTRVHICTGVRVLARECACVPTLTCVYTSPNASTLNLKIHR